MTTGKPLAYRVEDFISDLQSLTSTETMSDQRLEWIRSKMVLLLAGGDFLPEEAKTPSPFHYARRVLFEDPDKRFVVVAMVWGPGQGTPIHDHSTWGVVGVVSNMLRVVNYARVGRGPQANKAELREIGDVTAIAGDALSVIPPDSEIHRVENPTGATTITLDVYGREITECNRYNLQSKTFEPWKLAYEKGNSLRARSPKA